MVERDEVSGVSAGARAGWDELFSEMKKQWRMMWGERFDDRVRAEGIARREYPLLFLERGTVIVATRSYRVPSFCEVLERQRRFLGTDGDRGDVDPRVGGWGRFIRSTLKTQRRFSSRETVREVLRADERSALQKKKGGRGWIHRF